MSAAGVGLPLLEPIVVQLSVSAVSADKPISISSRRRLRANASSVFGPKSVRPTSGSTDATTSPAIRLSPHEPVPVGGSMAAGHDTLVGDGGGDGDGVGVGDGCVTGGGGGGGGGGLTIL